MKNITLVVFDFDGVMTDNRVLVDQSGHEAVWCHRGDGLGITRLKDAAFDIVVLSTERNPVVTARCRKLNIEAIQDCDDKLTTLQQVAAERKLSPAQIAYVGNDVNDLSCLQWVGWPIAVADALPEVRAAAKWVTRLPGGGGAVREVADRLVAARLNSDSAVDRARRAVWQSLEITQAMADSEQLLTQIVRVADTMAEVLRAGGRIVVFGEDGSAAIAQRLAAEIVRRVPREQRAGAATTLSVDRSVLTATGNEGGDGQTLSRQLKSLAQTGDIAIGITTSGNSVGVAQAMESSRALGLRTVAMTGTPAGPLLAATDECLCVPSDVTARIHEGHILIGHMLCDLAERALVDGSTRAASTTTV